MCKEKLITGIKVTHQMSKARNILNNQVIPREELFQVRKKEGKLSSERVHDKLHLSCIFSNIDDFIPPIA